MRTWASWASDGFVMILRSVPSHEKQPWNFASYKIHGLVLTHILILLVLSLEHAISRVVIRSPATCNFPFACPLRCKPIVGVKKRLKGFSVKLLSGKPTPSDHSLIDAFKILIVFLKVMVHRKSVVQSQQSFSSGWIVPGGGIVILSGPWWEFFESANGPEPGPVLGPLW